MDEKTNKTSSISKVNSYEEMGEFWDNHDLTDFDDPQNPDVEFNITCVVPIEQNLFSSIEKEAKKSGVDIETLINLWLQQKLHEETRMPSVA